MAASFGPQALGSVLDVAFVGQLSRAGDWAVWSRRGCGSVDSVGTALSLRRRAPWTRPRLLGGWRPAPGLLCVTPGRPLRWGRPPPTLGCTGPLGRCRAGCGDVGEENGVGAVLLFPRGARYLFLLRLDSLRFHVEEGRAQTRALATRLCGSGRRPCAERWRRFPVRACVKATHRCFSLSPLALKSPSVPSGER